MNDLISVIVPVYNIENYLSACIDSILSQSYQDIEIVAVDDGSTDRSGEVLDDYAARFPGRVIAIHQKNGGVTAARLHGASRAKGEWIAFVDGDDYVEPEMYAALMSYADENISIVHCGCRMVFQSRNELFGGNGKILRWSNLEGLSALLSGDEILPTLCNKLFRRELVTTLLQGGCMDSTIRELEDLLMNFYLFREAKESVYTDACYYHYLIRMGSSSVKPLLSPHKLQDPIRVQKLLLQETQGTPELQRIVYGRLAALYSGGAEMAPGTQPELIRPHRRMCRRELWRLLPRILFGGYDAPSVIHALLAAVSPDLCRAVHTAYAKRKGTYGKYEFSEGETQ